MSARALPAAALRPDVLDRLIPVFAVGAAFVAGWAVVERQTLIGLLAATLVCLPLLLNARYRLLWVTFGTLVFFGTTDELTAGKLAFLYGIAFALTGTLFYARALRHTRTFALLTPLFRASGAFAVLAVVSLVVSALNGTGQTDWLRDIAPYVLFAAAPLLALEAQRVYSERALELVLTVAGLVAAVSFGVKWATVRGIADLSALPAGFPSTLLASALGTYATAKLLTGSGRRLAWLLVGGATFSLLFVTGTRTTLVVLIAPFVIALASPLGLAARSLRLAVALPLMGLAVFVSLHTIVQASDADAQVLQQRISLLLSSGATTDLSYRDRLTQGDVAMSTFLDDPVAGVGPGVEFVWYDTFGERITSQSLDTPVSFAAKFGVLGLVWIAFVVAGFLGFYRALRRGGREPTAAQLAVLGYGAVVGAYAVLQVPLEDKGLAPAVVLLAALAVREWRLLHGDDRDEPAAGEVSPA